MNLIRINAFCKDEFEKLQECSTDYLIMAALTITKKDIPRKPQVLRSGTGSTVHILT
jgi:hypothetical protein